MVGVAPPKIRTSGFACGSSASLLKQRRCWSPATEGDEIGDEGHFVTTIPTALHCIFLFKMEESALSSALEGTHLTSRPTPFAKCLPTTLSRSYKILGVPTDAWVQVFSDRIVIGVTQREQKVGNWCLCQALQSPIDPKAIDFNINTVLGDRNDAMIGVYARRITERIIELRLIPGSNTMVVFLGISLKDQGKDPEMFRVVVDVLMKLVREALAQLKAG